MSLFDFTVLGTLSTVTVCFNVTVVVEMRSWSPCPVDEAPVLERTANLSLFRLSRRRPRVPPAGDDGSSNQLRFYGRLDLKSWADWLTAIYYLDINGWLDLKSWTVCVDCDILTGGLVSYSGGCFY